MTLQETIARGQAELEAGRWQEARRAFEEALGEASLSEVLAGLGDALFFLGQVRDGVQYRERAYAVSRRAGDTPAAVESAVWLCLTYAMALGNEVAAAGWLARAEGLVTSSTPSPLRAWLDYVAAVLTTDTHLSRRLLQKVEAAAHEFDDPDLALCALAERGVVEVKLGDVEPGLTCVDAAMAGILGGDHTSFFTVIMTSCSMLTVCDLIGDLDRAAKWTRAADGFMRDRGCPYLFAECRIVHGRMELLAGRWPAAEQELIRAADCARGTFPGMFNRAIATLAELRLRQGRLDQAESLIEGIDSPVEIALVAAGLALRRSDPASAVELARRWLRSSPDPVVPPKHAGGRGLSVETVCALSLLIEAHIAAGNLGSAREACAQLEALQPARGGDLVSAHAALARARIFAAEADYERSAACFEKAMGLFARLGMPLEAGRARLELARTLEPANHSMAVAEASAAQAAFDRLGAALDGDMAASLLRAWGARGRPASQKAAELLTRREREILGLLKAGMSNQEIADRLYISPRTASHHVSSLLGKLGVRNRAEAAAYAARVDHQPAP